jgi:hypothetical protein
MKACIESNPIATRDYRQDPIRPSTLNSETDIATIPIFKPVIPLVHQNVSSIFSGEQRHSPQSIELQFPNSETNAQNEERGFVTQNNVGIVNRG